MVASFRGQFVFFSATIQRRGTFQGVVPPLAFSRSPLIREAAARLLPAGLQGGRYYPCGFLAMSFFSRKLIDGAENCGVSTRRQCYLINLDGMPFADSLLSFLSTVLSFFLSIPFLVLKKRWKGKSRLVFFLDGFFFQVW